MTEFAFYRRIVFREYPGAILVLIFNELLGVILLMLGIGTIIPLFAELLGGNGILPAPFNEIFKGLGVLEWPTTNILIFLAGLVFAQVLLDMVRMYIAGSIGIHLNLTIKKKMNAAMVNAEWERFLDVDQGKYMQCMVAESSLARGAVSDMAAALAFGFITTLLLGWLAIYSIGTFIVFCIFGIIYTISSRSLMASLRRVSENRIAKMTSLNVKVTDIRHVFKFLMAEGLLKKMGMDVRSIIKKIAIVEKHQLFLSLLAKHIVSLVGLLIIISVSILHLVFYKNTGEAILFDLIILQRVSAYFSNFQVKRQSMLQKIPSYEACLDMIKVVGPSRLLVNNNHVLKALEKGLDVRNISFSYKKGPLVLKDINLHIPARGMVFFLGSSGCGKTTLIDVILGLLKPEKNGHVLIEGEKLSHIKEDDWSQLIAYVPQDAYILSGTIRNYLTFGNDSLTNSKIWDTLESVKIDEVINQLSEGLDTEIKDGGNSFSGGERHRLSIARALIREAKILVLDEPSSSLDKNSEKVVFQTLKTLAKEILVIVVTHSREPIKEADYLYVFDAGEISWSGSYEHYLESELNSKSA
jgi:ATP-binding cassette, subfamily C, bacterial